MLLLKLTAIALCELGSHLDSGSIFRHSWSRKSVSIGKLASCVCFRRFGTNASRLFAPCSPQTVQHLSSKLCCPHTTPQSRATTTEESAFFRCGAPEAAFSHDKVALLPDCNAFTGWVSFPSASAKVVKSLSPCSGAPPFVLRWLCGYPIRKGISERLLAYKNIESR